MCGAIGGCGGAFLPLNKGLEPMKKGLGLPMATAFFGAALFHLYVNTSLSDGCVDAHAKAHVHLAMFFVASGLIQALDLSTAPKAKIKKE